MTVLTTITAPAGKDAKSYGKPFPSRDAMHYCRECRYCEARRATGIPANVSPWSNEADPYWELLLDIEHLEEECVCEHDEAKCDAFSADDHEEECGQCGAVDEDSYSYR